MIQTSLGLSSLSYRQLEQLNSPFTEFGWYHLGQAGKLSTLLETLWDDVHAKNYSKIDELERVM
jgi:hypothetical protein